MAEQSRRFVSLDKLIDKFIEDQKKQEPAKEQRKWINRTRRKLLLCFLLELLCLSFNHLSLISL